MRDEDLQYYANMVLPLRASGDYNAAEAIEELLAEIRRLQAWVRFAYEHTTYPYAQQQLAEALTGGLPDYD
jgi:hypothetical protein